MAVNLRNHSISIYGDAGVQRTEITPIIFEIFKIQLLLGANRIDGVGRLNAAIDDDKITF